MLEVLLVDAFLEFVTVFLKSFELREMDLALFGEILHEFIGGADSNDVIFFIKVDEIDEVFGSEDALEFEFILPVDHLMSFVEHELFCLFDSGFQSGPGFVVVKEVVSEHFGALWNVVSGHGSQSVFVVGNEH